MTNTEAKFYDGIGPSDDARKFVANLLKHLSGDALVEIHYKCPERPELRIRDLRKIPGKRQQNIFTLQWQTIKHRFLCRALADNSFCRAYGATDVRVPLDEGEPLRSEFIFLPTGNPSLLATIVKESILQR